MTELAHTICLLTIDGSPPAPDNQAVFWLAVLLAGTVTAVALMLCWLMLLNYRHERRLRREAAIRATFEPRFTDWLTRAPLTTELARIKALPATDALVFLKLCAEYLTITRSRLAERVGHLLQESGLFTREINRLRHRSWGVRADACWNLGRLTIRESIPPLIARLDDRHPVVRISAIIALSNLRAAEAVVPIIRSLEKYKGWADLRAGMALQKIGPQIGSQIEELLQTPLSPEALKTSLQIIGQLNTAGNPALIRRFALHADPEIRVDAVRALSRIEPDDESVEICISALMDDHWPVRAIAAQSLGLLADRRAIEFLEISMSDQQYWVRHHAAEALSRLGEQGLQSLARQARSEDQFVREMAAQMLFIKQQKSVQV